MARVILSGVEPDDFILATRAAKWLLARPEQKSAIVLYGDGEREQHFYVCRNKASITVTPC